jgi:hypothetical protein
MTLTLFFLSNMQGFNPISPNEERSQTVILLMRIFMIILVFGIIAEIATTFHFHQHDYAGSEGKILMGIVALIAVMRGLFYIVVAVFFIMWMRRAYHNLHKAGSPHLRHSEGWASGAWFVPFLNLVWPVQIMVDIWNETQNVYRRQDQPYQRIQDTITSGWWALFITAGVVSYIGSLALKFRNFEAGYAFSALGDIGYVFAAFLAVSMIKKISAMETEMMQRAEMYYAWVNQQYAQQYQQQQQNPQQQNPFQQPNPFQQNPQQQQNYYRPPTDQLGNSNESDNNKPPTGL